MFGLGIPEIVVLMALGLFVAALAGGTTVRDPQRIADDATSFSPSVELSGLVAVLASCLLFLASLFFPALIINPGGSLNGLALLLIGFVGPNHGIYGWFANPLYASAMLCVLTKAYRSAALLSMGSLVLAMTTLSVKEVPSPSMGRITDRVDGYGTGFSLWVAAIYLVVLYSFYSMVRSRSFAATAGREPQPS